MNYLSENKKFSFESLSLDKDTFGVVSFTGSEGLSRLYQFDILLVANDANIDMDAVMMEPASFYIHRPDRSRVPFHGMIAEFELVRAVGSFYLYRALLVPRLWRLTRTHHNQIFLNSTPQEIIKQVLEDGGLTSLDFEFRLQGDYVTWEYACQYGESHYEFISRWMERNGIYFFFDQSGGREKLIMTDSRMAHVPSPFGDELTYAPVSGLETMHLDETIQSFVCRRQQVPNRVTLKDYNYRKPSLSVQGSAEVDSSGQGEMYFYGEHFRTPEEGNKLAKIRSEEFICQAKQFHGESTVPYLMPGYTFSLKGHFRQDMNRGYHVISIEHRGNQASFLISGIRENLSVAEKESVYQNSFTAIEDSVQFRAPRVTERPRIHGTINGRIDAAGTGKYAEVDQHGRYKVILPFDRSGRSGGKASAWIRMMQPYGGSDHGMHFPLHKDCEVLLTFIDGDPDRPVISGAVPNPEHPSPVTTDNQTMALLTTCGGNKIHIEDKEGSERILLHSPKQGSLVRIGAEGPEDVTSENNSENHGNENEEDEGPSLTPEFMKKDHEHYGIHLMTNGLVDVQAATVNEVILGDKTDWIGGVEAKTVLGLEAHTILVAAIHFKKTKWEFSNEHSEIEEEKMQAIAEVNRAVENLNSVVEEANNVKGEVNDVVGEANRVKGEVNDVVGEANRVKGEVNDVVGEANRVKGEVNDVVGEANRVKGEVNDVVGEANRVKGEVNEIAASKNQVIADVVKSVLEQAKIVGSDDQVVGMKIVV